MLKRFKHCLHLESQYCTAGLDVGLGQQRHPPGDARECAAGATRGEALKGRAPKGFASAEIDQPVVWAQNSKRTLGRPIREEPFTLRGIPSAKLKNPGSSACWFVLVASQGHGCIQSLNVSFAVGLNLSILLGPRLNISLMRAWGEWRWGCSALRVAFTEDDGWCFQGIPVSLSSASVVLLFWCLVVCLVVCLFVCLVVWLVG